MKGEVNMVEERYMRKTISEAAETIAMGSIIIAQSIFDSASLISYTQERNATKNREQSFINTKWMVDGILSGSRIIENGLRQIASELYYTNIITEKRNLETKINSIEEWLFTNGFLKEFYETADLSQTIPYVKNNFGRFLSYICGCRKSDIESYRDKDLNSVYKQLIAKNGGIKQELTAASMITMSHPLVILADLITKNGLCYKRDNGDNFRIGSTHYSYKNNEIIDHNSKRLWIDADYTLQFEYGSSKIVFKCNDNILQKIEYYTFPSFKEALEYLIQIATNFEEKNKKEVLAERLEWDNFFSEINMKIALNNLRILADKLESFKRQKMLDML